VVFRDAAKLTAFEPDGYQRAGTPREGGR
jgi:hypothetical protein